MLLKLLPILFIFLALPLMAQELSSSQVQLNAKIDSGPWQGRTLKVAAAVLSDNQGEVFRANKKGVVNLESAKGSIYFHLASPRFNVFADYLPEKVLLGRKSDLKGTVVDLSEFYSSEALLPRILMEKVYFEIVEVMPGLKSLPWFNGKKIDVNVDFGAGCNAGWNGRGFIFYRAEGDCISASLIPDIIIHEFAHGFQENALGYYHSFMGDLGEGIADAFMLLWSNDSYFADNFYPERHPTYIRDLEAVVSYPDGWRGTYSGSMIFSTGFYETLKGIKDFLPKEKRRKKVLDIFLSPLLESLYQLSMSSGAPDENLYDFSRYFAELLSYRLSQEGREELRCIPILAFAKRGIQVEGDCLSKERQIVHYTEQGLRVRGQGVSEVILFTDGVRSSYPVEDQRVVFPEKLCGQRIKGRAFPFSDGVVGPGNELTIIQGDSETRTVELLPKENRAGVIPDNDTEGISFNFSLDESDLSSWTIVDAKIVIDIEHVFSQDLSILVEREGGKRTLYKGIEELPIPQVHSLRPWPLEKSISLRIIDSGKNFEGKLLSEPRIRLTLQKKGSCPRL